MAFGGCFTFALLFSVNFFDPCIDKSVWLHSLYQLVGYSSLMHTCMYQYSMNHDEHDIGKTFSKVDLIVFLTEFRKHDQ